MSDQTQAVPAQTQTSATPPAPAPTTTDAPRTVGDARLALRNNLELGQQQQQHHSQSQPRDEVGRFADEANQADAPAPSEEGVVQEPVEAEASAETGQQEAVERPAERTAEGRSFKGVVPSEWEMVELPEGHPLRDRGVTHWPVIPGFENDTRNLISNPVKRRELDEAFTESRTLKQRVAEIQAEAEFWVEKAALFLRNPDLGFKVRQIEEDHGAAVAEAYVERVLREGITEMNEKVEKAREEFTETEVASEASRFVAMARTAIASKYSDLNLSPQEVDGIIAGYGQLLANGVVDRPHAETLFRHADNALSNHPTIKARSEAELQKRIKEEARKLREQEELEARRKAQANPMGKISAASYGSRVSSGTNVPVVPDGSAPAQSVADVRANLRNQPLIGS